MKKIFSIALIYTILGTNIMAQQSCNSFECAYQKALYFLETSNLREKYNKVLANLDDAENFAGNDTSKKDKIKVLRQKALLAIQKEKERADVQAEIAQEQVKIANAQKLRADSASAANRRQALGAYSNDLVYKSQIALQDGKRTEAFQIVNFAYRYVEPENPNVIRALFEALYYNEVLDHSPLPWSTALEGYTRGILDVVFSPDGKRLATTGDGVYSAKIWDLVTGKPIFSLKGDNNVNSVAFSPDGKRLATGSTDNTAKIWDLASGKPILSLQGHSDDVRSVAFSPDGKRLATGSWDNSAKIWDLDSGKPILILQHNDNVSSVAFSPDGKRLATGSYDQSVKIWDVGTGKQILSLEGHSSYIRSVAFSPDGKRLATGSDDKSAKIWDIGTGKQILTLEGHNSYVRSIAFSPDGKRLATGSRDMSTKIWDLASGKPILSLQGHSYDVSSIAFSPDGKRLATGSEDKSTKIWDVNSGELILTLEGHRGFVESVAFSSDGKRLATGSTDYSAKIWDLDSGKAILNLQGHNDIVSSVAFSPDGKRLATGSWDNSAKIWDLASGKPILSLQGHSKEVSSITFSHDGKELATCSEDKSAKIWKIDPDEIIQEVNKYWNLSPISGPQLIAYNLENLLDLHPNNEAKLIATREVWQIKAFADLASAQAGVSNELSVVEAPYARANRLYAAALTLQNESLIRIDWANMMQKWAAVYRDDGKEEKAKELERKADALFKEVKE